MFGFFIIWRNLDFFARLRQVIHRIANIFEDQQESQPSHWG